MTMIILPALAFLLASGPSPGDPRAESPAPTPIIEDIFGRSLEHHGLILVDWEGPIANPAIRLDLVPPHDVAYPVRLVIRAREPRLYLDRSSQAGPDGPSKEVVLNGPARSTIAVSIFPDRDGRWQITRTDLLFARAIGYRLRETSAFAPVVLQTETLADGSISAPYATTLRASGGIPFYHWEVTAGSLPDGLSLDRFAGEERGTPKRPGLSEFTVRVRDYDVKSAGASRKLRIRISPD